ncbi:EF-hand domain-containing protein [Rhodopirellula bahusiensis]|uniref:EF-hand domain-containing protein n=1 Tax=Rhodopirellula bahusiensis TaxID=2014065 RepID=UPI0032671588
MNRTLQCIVLAGTILLPNLLAAQPPGRGGQGGMNGRGGPPPEMIYQLFTTADSNNDGSVTKSELMAVMQNQSRGNQLGRGGPPPMNGNFGPGNLGPGNPGGEQPPQREPGGQHGPPPQPGQVLPEPIAQSLNLNERQSRQLAALQAEVDRRLAAILTDEQEDQLQNARPPQGPNPMEVGGEPRPNQRPQRPQ